MDMPGYHKCGMESELKPFQLIRLRLMQAQSKKRMP